MVLTQFGAVSSGVVGVIMALHAVFSALEEPAPNPPPVSPVWHIAPQ